MVRCLDGTECVLDEVTRMKMGKIVSIEIRNRKFYIGAVMSFLDSIVSNHKTLDFSRYNRLRYVVGEMLKRRIERAYPGAEGIITVEVYLTERYLEVSIKDKGVPSWMESNDVQDGSEGVGGSDYSSEQNMRNLLMDFMTDDFGMEKLGRDGQRIFVRMNILRKIVFQEPEPYPETKALDTNITIKEVKTPKDAIEAIRCIYSEYGYSYCYERLYYIDSFMEAIERGELRSFLAVNEHGQTAGHFALSFSDKFKNMPEISTVVTRKEFRGLGLFGRFMDHCMKLGKECGFRALMGQPVAFHPLSQKAFIKSEFTASATLLSYISSEIESEYNKDNKRLDVFAGIKMLDEDAHSVIYPPQEIKAYTEKIFDKAGYSYEIGDAHLCGNDTVISVETNSSMKVTKMAVAQAGADFEKILKGEIKNSIRGNVEMIELLISLNDGGCQFAYNIAKKCEFVFAGLLPGSETADYIVMQMLVGEDCTYDQLVCVGEFEEIKNDIVRINNR